MNWRSMLIAIAAVVPALAGPARAEAPRFERTKISDTKFEAACVVDVDRDGAKDIVSGGFWYAGPDFKAQHKIWDVMESSGYHDDFADYPLDVNGDGYPDIITGGWFGKKLRWLENPQGKPVEWKLHDIAEPGNIETIRFWDVDGDGFVEVCPNAAGNVIFWRLVRDANGKGTGKFTEHVVKRGGCGHGLGFGDVNGDGRGDFVAPGGWVEAPANPLDGEWTWHAEFDLGHASIPILVHDVNGDGRADLIVGHAHGYGLRWWEQGTGDEGKRTWTKHEIDTKRSQYHDIALADLDKDGKPELVTGKRRYAHNGNDPGGNDPVFVCYFRMDGTRFERVDLDFGPADTASGVGIYFWVEDVDGNGWEDIVAPGKEGLYLFRNMGAG